jgi:hypothetical protein
MTPSGQGSAARSSARVDVRHGGDHQLDAASKARWESRTSAAEQRGAGPPHAQKPRFANLVTESVVGSTRGSFMTDPPVPLLAA